MKIIQSDSYEDMGAEFQYQMIQILNKTLAKSGLPKEIRKEICGEFIFNLSMLHDQGAVNVNEKVYRPLFCFQEGDSLFIPNGEFDYHEYAFGNVDELFEGE